MVVDLEWPLGICPGGLESALRAPCHDLITVRFVCLQYGVCDGLLADGRAEHIQPPDKVSVQTSRRPDRFGRASVVRPQALSDGSEPRYEQLLALLFPAAPAARGGRSSSVAASARVCLPSHASSASADAVRETSDAAPVSSHTASDVVSGALGEYGRGVRFSRYRAGGKRASDRKPNDFYHQFFSDQYGE